MKRLTNLKKFTLALVFALIGVISWGQSSYWPMNSCEIRGVNDYYSYTGSSITVNYTVYDTYSGYELTEIDEYTKQFVNKATNEIVTSISEVGNYILLITGAESEGGYSGVISKEFCVIDTKLYNLSEEGTEIDPYIIENENDWIALAIHPEYWDAEKYVKLAGNVTVGESIDGIIVRNGLMVGTSDNPFKGIFIGDHDNIENKYYTLTFYYNDHGNEGIPVAPFQYTNAAEFKNFKVAGEIKKYVYGSAGLIGHNTGATKVEEVIVGLNINCGDWDGKSTIWSHRCGGFAVDGSGAEFKKCIYNGEIQTVIEDRNGGFCGKGTAQTSFNSCLYNPASGSKLNGVVFANGGIDYANGGYVDVAIGQIADCYYTFIDKDVVAQGSKVYLSDVFEDDIAKKSTYESIHGNFDIYKQVEVSVSGVKNDYPYTGNEIPITHTVTFDGVNASGNYTVTYANSYGDVTSSVVNMGDYNLIINGVNANGYYGSMAKASFSVSSNVYGNWGDLQALLSGETNTIDLDKNYIAGASDATLTISRNVTINLNGYTIDRDLESATANGQVLKINSGCTVVINGPGTITGGYNKEDGSNIDGGGITNKGNLTLNKVTISGNHCVKKNESSTTATGRGGGIYSGQNSTLHIYGCVIRDNSAHGGAGGVFADRTTSFIVGDYSDSKSTVHASIRSNTSKDKGGGLRIKGTAELNNCEIIANEVNNGTYASVANGGGIHLDDGTLTLNNCTINNNTASKYGGGIYAIAGTINANGCEINYNKSYDEANLFEGRGGGVYMYGGSFKMNGGSVSGNSSNLANGGGIYINSGAKFELKGTATINDNWKFDDNGKKQTTNVFLTGSTVIKVTGSITGSNVGVARSNGEGVFTQDLEKNGHGTIACFNSDDTDYSVVEFNSEAKLKLEEQWVPGAPAGDGYVYINDAVSMSDVQTINGNGIKFGSNGSLTILPGGYLEAKVVNDDPTKLVIYGGQLVTTSENVKATVKKDISGALALSSQYWYLISTAIDNSCIKDNTNLIKISANDYAEYDLYRFNESVTNNLQWENYRSTDPVHSGFSYSDAASILQNGRGYLYRNANDYTITISGTLNTGTITTPTLTCTATVGDDDNIFKGFNIIGNPYSHNIKKGAAGNAIVNGDLLEDNYYRLLEDGTWNLGTDGDIIPPFEGIMVQAKSNSTLTINNVAVDPSSKGEIVREAANDNIWFTISNNQFEDCACVQFKKGHGLNKIAHQNENAPMLYINYNGEDFASVDMSKDVKSINLNFDAKTTGYYTLSMKSDGEFDYIHLIDRLTGDDIDMLQEEEYTFIGSASDNADRFLVRLSPSTGSGTSSGTFAWQNGNDIIVNGNGELLVFDVMGRMVATRHINGVQTINLTQTGVYIFRLEGKTQKIIVR